MTRLWWNRQPSQPQTAAGRNDCRRVADVRLGHHCRPSPGEDHAREYSDQHLLDHREPGAGFFPENHGDTAIILMHRHFPPPHHLRVGGTLVATDGFVLNVTKKSSKSLD